MKNAFLIKNAIESSAEANSQSIENTKSFFDSKNDPQIWEMFRQGQEIAFIHIYRKNFNDLFQYGIQFSSNEALIEDAIQDMFIELREKRAKCQIKSSIKNYLFTCMRRRILLYKKKFEDKLTSLDNSETIEFDITLSAEQRIIESQLSRESSEKLDKAIKGLSLRQREAIYYLFYEGMDYTEIMELMNFSNIRSVRNLIYRAIKSMKSAVSMLILCLSMPV
ncbi:MAG: sigma-70 family RNA polymerase sigma factor [Cyclobacteriaceae bacterium]